MSKTPNPLIAQLAEELEPVRPLTLGRGIGFVLAACVAMVAGLAAVEGLSGALLSADAQAAAFIANGLFVVVGAASALAVLDMARPQVGNRPSGARWSMVALVVLPLAAVLATTLAGSWSNVAGDTHGPSCALAGTVAGLAVGTALVLYLRRGAPVSITAAGLYTGVAAGALGSAAYGLSCPLDSVGHLGLWHVLPIAISALLGRLVVPRLVRW